MGKSSKKSATKVEATPAAATSVKPMKKGLGKREAEDAIAKKVSAKKQKKDGSIEQAVQKEKVEMKTQKKKAESSSSDSSDSEEEQKVKKVATNKKPPAKDSSSEEDSSSDDEPAVTNKKPAAVKNGNVVPPSKVKPASSDESSEEESSSDEEPKAVKKPSPAAKNGAVGAAAKKGKVASSSSEDESFSDDEPALVKQQPASVKSGKPASDDSSSSENESSDEEPVTKKQPATATNGSVSVTAKKGKPASGEETSSEDESSSDEEADAKKITTKTAKKESSSEESGEDSEDDEESEEEKTTPKKKDNDVEMVDVPAEKTPKQLKTPAAQAQTGSKTLFAGNLSFQVERADVENFFKDAGEVVDVRFATGDDGRFRGFGHVEFASEEAAQKALELNGQSLLGREVRLDLARERGANTPSNGGGNSFQSGGKGQSQTVFVKGLDTSLGENEVRSALEEHFGSCGEISRISIPGDRESGYIKGFAYIDLKSGEAFNKALELNGSDMDGYTLTVDEARPRESFDGAGGRSGGRSGGRGFGRSGGRDSGGRFGGRDSGGRFGGRGGRGRGGFGGRGRGFDRPSITASAQGKKTTFGDD